MQARNSNFVRNAPCVDLNRIIMLTKICFRHEKKKSFRHIPYDTGTSEYAVTQTISRLNTYRGGLVMESSPKKLANAPRGSHPGF